MYAMYEDNCNSCTYVNQTNHGEPAIDTSSFKIGQWENEKIPYFVKI